MKRCAKSPRAVAVVAILSIGTLAFAAPATDSPISIDAMPQFSDFMSLEGRAFAEAQGKPSMTNLFLPPLPSLSIYSPEGDLIYEGGGDVRAENYALLEKFPSGTELLHPIANRPKLAAMLNVVPEFKAREKEILGDHHYVIYAITYPQGQPSRTEREIQGLRSRGGVPVDTLLLKLQP